MRVYLGSNNGIKTPCVAEKYQRDVDTAYKYLHEIDVDMTDFRELDVVEKMLTSIDNTIKRELGRAPNLVRLAKRIHEGEIAIAQIRDYVDDVEYDLVIIYTPLAFVENTIYGERYVIRSKDAIRRSQIIRGA